MNYVISASELYHLAKEMLNDGMDYVSISLIEADEFDPDDPIPARVHFEARKKRGFMWTDYEDIEVEDIAEIE